MLSAKCWPYNTSGASETIFKNFFSRSSRATGPNTRVPTGSPASLIRTAAFWSKRIYVPSRRRCSFRVRTITAFTTLPFCTWPSGADSLTAAVITSPSPAFNPVEPPSGRIICSLRAPELSATSSIDLIITAMASISLFSCHSEHAQSAGEEPAFPGSGTTLDCRVHNRFRHQRGLAHNVFQLPALQLRQRTGFLDPHHIADVRLVLLVMRVELLVARHHPSVKRMRLLARHLHHNRLLHAVGQDFAHHFLAAALRLRRRLG